VTDGCVHLSQGGNDYLHCSPAARERRASAWCRAGGWSRQLRTRPGKSTSSVSDLVWFKRTSLVAAFGADRPTWPLEASSPSRPSRPSRPSEPARGV